MGPKQALLELLRAVEETEALDRDIEDYLIGVLDPDNIDEESLDLVLPLLSGASTAFAKASDEQQTKLLLELLQKVSEIADNCFTWPAVSPTCSFLRQPYLPQVQQDTSSSDSEDTDLSIPALHAPLPVLLQGTEPEASNICQHAAVTSAVNEAADEAGLQALADLCQHTVSWQFLKSILHEKHSCNMQVGGITKTLYASCKAVKSIAQDMESLVFNDQDKCGFQVTSMK